MSVPYKVRKVGLEAERSKLFKEWDKEVLDKTVVYQSYAESEPHRDTIRRDLARRLANLDVYIWMGEQLLLNAGPNQILTRADSLAKKAATEAEPFEAESDSYDKRWQKHTSVNTSREPHLEWPWGLKLKRMANQAAAQAEYHRQLSLRYGSLSICLRRGETVDQVAAKFGSYGVTYKQQQLRY